MLTKSDEKNIQRLMSESVKGLATKGDLKGFITRKNIKGLATKDDIEKLTVDLKEIRKDTRKIRIDLEMVTGEFDKELIEVKKRVDRLETTPFSALQ